tara:strand:- start:216 stop:398 length:183 start_codon:yes stop_codon:yes gene_type:complete
MRAKLAILVVVLFFGGCAAKKIYEFKQSPAGQIVDQLQERKELIEELKKSQLQLPTQINK